MEGFAMVSHQTMYRWIWEYKCKKGALYQYLRQKGKKYNKRGDALSGKGYIPNRIDIEERPAIVDLKERFGDLEKDTVIGRNHKGTCQHQRQVNLKGLDSKAFGEGGFTNFFLFF